MDAADAYQPDRSLKGKVRRRAMRLIARRPARLAGGAGMVSFTFDDAPLSAATMGAQVLAAKGHRGAYYVSAGLSGQDSPMGRIAEADDYLRLAAAGHEIACHTFSHLDLGQASGAEAAADVERNARALAAWGLPPPRHFAYPYGDVALGPKRALAPRFETLRALHHGKIAGGADLNQTPAVGIEGADGEAVAARWLKRAAEAGAWLILYTHDVAETPSPWGCTPGALARLIAAAEAEGMAVVTLSQGARRLAG